MKKVFLKLMCALMVAGLLTGCKTDYKAQILEQLSAEAYFFNGGSDSKLNQINFTKDEATVVQYSFTGNGKSTGATKTYKYEVDENNIVVTLDDGSALTIAYTYENGQLEVGGNEYQTLSEVDAGLQGYWKNRKSMLLLGSLSTSEANVYINNGTITYESASQAYGRYDGSYYYYGPYTASYTLNNGGFNSDVRNAMQFGFNIIDGKANLMIYANVCKATTATKLPGQKGYKF